MYDRQYEDLGGQHALQKPIGQAGPRPIGRAWACRTRFQARPQPGLGQGPGLEEHFMTRGIHKGQEMMFLGLLTEWHDWPYNRESVWTWHCDTQFDGF